MKTFRCVFLNGHGRKTIDVSAPDPQTAARRAIAQFRGLIRPRIDYEGDDGHLYVSPAPPGGPATDRVRVFPLPAAA